MAIRICLDEQMKALPAARQQSGPILSNRAVKIRVFLDVSPKILIENKKREVSASLF
jgi:hypothetical protein